MERGADVNAATDYEFFPLTMAAHRNHHRVAGYLLDHGADLNRLGQCRRSALFFAIEYNAHDTVELLLARGADWTGPGSDAEPTLLHFAARFADTRTLQVLAESVCGEFCLEELEAEDADGFVLEELLRKRIRDGGEGVDLGFEEAFQRLLDRVASPREADGEGDEGEIWEDAVETMEDSVSA